MPNNENPSIPDGWIGGFAGTNERFAYPTTDLRALHMLKNMDNIGLLERQQAILWPEFSWESEQGASDPKRCFQMFAPDISRIGYTNEGRVYSIICPQQGVETPSLGSINIEVTVTGQRGWVDEDTRELACDMSVEGRVWFAPGHQENPAFQLLVKPLEDLGHDLPISKDKAIVVRTHKPGEPDQPVFALSKGETTRFAAPDFARHPDEAWSVGHIEVQIGAIEPTPHAEVNEFNQVILDILNMSSGNMLKNGNVLTWNVWFNHPEPVDQRQWRDHAEKWRLSIDTEHTSPERQRSVARLHDGTPFDVVENLMDHEVNMIHEFITAQASLPRRLFRMWKPVARSLRLPKLLGG